MNDKDRAKVIVSLELYVESLEKLTRDLEHLGLVMDGRVFVRVEASSDLDAAEQIISLSKEVG